jgi:membrane-bound inhibitor of C-type lysozyme
VHLEFGYQKTLYLPQTISASGARYANDDESVVFWNKGDTAFMTEGASAHITYKDCKVVGN